ncbi:MAG: hypothetical protein D3926_06795 [Desulfobacteraceae bacterium]|nr:MAG: hypothetical protein D3926_06795 [Desulfobacteraceae bacterium]
MLLDIGSIVHHSEKDKFEFKHDLILDTMNTMGYDVMNLSRFDLKSSLNFLEHTCKKSDMTLVSANNSLKAPDNECLAPYVIKTVNGVKIGITGVMFDLPLKGANAQRYSIERPHLALQRIIPELKSKSDFIILLSELVANDTQELVDMIPGIDLALCIDNSPVNTARVPETKVMSIIDKGQELGVITLENSDQPLSIKHIERVSLDNTIPSDPSVKKIVDDQTRKAFLAKRKKNKPNIPPQPSKDDMMKNLKLSPEEFLKQYDKPITD